jgi:ethanolamine ammonia-lyase large subunit
MARYQQTFGHTRHVFNDLRAVMACASPLRSGDQLAGIAANEHERRVAARFLLADLPLATFLEDALIPYEDDEITRLIIDSHDARAFELIASMTVGELREWLLSEAASAQALAILSTALTPEMVAAVCKLMGNLDLISVSAKCRVVSSFRTTIGLQNRLAVRLQPNHPTDDPKGIIASTIDGLLYGAGDAVIGINPASDNVDACIRLLEVIQDFRERYQIPTQSCVLSHVTTSIAAIEQAAPLDLVFQSIAGSEVANASFGISLQLLKEAHDAVQGLGRAPSGANLMYFETGQGSALSSNGHHGVDQQTMEVRAYGVARAFQPLLVNTVVGFIGPEYLYDGKQIIRAGLEDHFCGKLLGLPMGVDVCYTNHAEADQDDMDTLASLLCIAGTNFVIAVPGSDDVMLNYQSLSFHDIASLRHNLGMRPAPEFEAWLMQMGLVDDDCLLVSPEKSKAHIRSLFKG